MNLFIKYINTFNYCLLVNVYLLFDYKGNITMQYRKKINQMTDFTKNFSS